MVHMDVCSPYFIIGDEKQTNSAYHLDMVLFHIFFFAKTAVAPHTIPPTLTMGRSIKLHSKYSNQKEPHRKHYDTAPFSSILKPIYYKLFLLFLFLRENMLSNCF